MRIAADQGSGGGSTPAGGRGGRAALLVAGGVVLAVLGLCVAGGLYVITRPPPARTDAAGRFKPVGGPAALPAAAIPGVSLQRLVASLRDITGMHTTYSVLLRYEGGFDEGVTDPGAGTVLLVSVRAADPLDGVDRASCRYTDRNSPLTVDGAMTEVVRRCALAALPPAQDASAVAWLLADRQRTQTRKFGEVWVTAYRGTAEFGVAVSA